MKYLVHLLTMLSYCFVQFVQKDEKFQKWVLFQGELEEVLEATQPLQSSSIAWCHCLSILAGALTVLIPRYYFNLFAGFWFTIF